MPEAKVGLSVRFEPPPATVSPLSVASVESIGVSPPDLALPFSRIFNSPEPSSQLPPADWKCDLSAISQSASPCAFVAPPESSAFVKVVFMRNLLVLSSGSFAPDTTMKYGVFEPARVVFAGAVNVLTASAVIPEVGFVKLKMLDPGSRRNPSGG